MKRTFIILTMLLAAIAVNAQLTKIVDFADSSNGMTPLSKFYYNGTFLYGTTHDGGSNFWGTAFRIKPDGTRDSILISFGGTVDGTYPSASFISDGTYLYGVSDAGGAHGNGTIFKIKPDGSGYLKMYDFQLGTDGTTPVSTFISDGTYYYGMTYGGGTYGFGTIFKIKPDGSDYSIIYNFDGAPDGNYPEGSLIYDGTYLYGMTYQGGANADGIIFKIKTDGTGYLKMHDFGSSASDGIGPMGSFISDGTFLYGMTYGGGTGGYGTVFKIKPDGTGDTTIYNFMASPDGSAPYGDLVSDGTFLYGMTDEGGTSDGGTIFRIMPDGTDYSKLLNFGTVESDGLNPQGSLIYDGTYFYGMTSSGGIDNDGIAFKFKPVITGLAINKEAAGFTIHPNPASDIITIECPQEAIIEITSIQGQLIKTIFATGNKTNIDVSALQTGVYVVEVKTEKGIAVQKFVKD